MTMKVMYAHCKINKTIDLLEDDESKVIKSNTRNVQYKHGHAMWLWQIETFKTHIMQYLYA